MASWRDCITLGTLHSLRQPLGLLHMHNVPPVARLTGVQSNAQLSLRKQYLCKCTDLRFPALSPPHEAMTQLGGRCRRALLKMLALFTFFDLDLNELNIR